MSNIKILFMDIDGTLTDGKIYMGDKGEIMKAFNVRDGYGIRTILRANGIEPVVITNRESEIIIKRCKELGIKYIYQGCKNKDGVIREVADKFGLETTQNGGFKECAYIGDDIPDILGMKLCEYVGCPSDAVDEVKSISHYTCKKKGGEGAVREFIEWLVKYNEVS